MQYRVPLTGMDCAISESGETVVKLTDSFLFEPDVSGTIFIDTPTKIFCPDDLKNKPIRYDFQVAGTSLSFENCFIDGNVEGLDNSTLKFNKCIITRSLNKSGFFISVCRKSSIFVSDCYVYDVPKPCFVGKNDSHGEFTNTTFENIENSAILFTFNTSLSINNCKFLNIKRRSIFIGKDSVADVTNCHFEGKGNWTVQMFSSRNVEIKLCVFKNITHHSIMMSSSAKALINGCIFDNIGFSGIYITTLAKATISSCAFMKMPGNGVVIDGGVASISKCDFKRIEGPVITIVGPKSSVKIEETKVRQTKSHAIVARDCSTPVFERCMLTDVGGSAFSLSNFTRAVVRQNIINGSRGPPFIVSNGAAPLIDHNRVLKSSSFVRSISGAMPYVVSNIFNGDITQPIVEMGSRSHGFFSGNFVLPKSNQIRGFSVLDGKAVVHELQVTSQLEDNHITSQQDKYNPQIVTYSRGFRELRTEYLLKEHRRLADMEIPEFVKYMGNGEFDFSPHFCSCGKVAMINVPCGHMTSCSQCNSGVCKLCLTPVAEQISFQDVIVEPLCMKCQKPANCLCLGCGHLSVCYECANTTAQKYRLCPKCNSPFISAHFQFKRDFE